METTDKKTDGPSYVVPLIYAYSSTKHGSTGYSLYYLMFGRHPCLPIDIVLGWDQLEKEPKGAFTPADLDWIWTGFGLNLDKI